MALIPPTPVGGVNVSSRAFDGMSKRKRNVYERLGVNDIYNMVDEKSLQTKQEVVIIEGTHSLSCIHSLAFMHSLTHALN